MGRQRLTRIVAEGLAEVFPDPPPGGGRVVLARAEVAREVLPDELARSAERRMRFEREASAIAALNHPNIVTIYSVEVVEGVHFLTDGEAIAVVDRQEDAS